MRSKFFLSLFQLILMCSFLTVFSASVNCQIGLADTGVSLRLSVSSGKTDVPARPRIYNDTSNESAGKKAVTNFAFERIAFDEINRQRTAVGLKSLIWNDDVAKIARIHSENMANFKFFSHQGLDGSMVNNRADANGVSKWRAIGENITFNQGYKNPIEFAVECWMKSNGHRENILNERWQESGIGIAITADGAYYFTEVFLERK